MSDPTLNSLSSSDFIPEKCKFTSIYQSTYCTVVNVFNNICYIHQIGLFWVQMSV